MRRSCALAAGLLAVVVLTAGAAKQAPGGLLAASVGDQVVLADPGGGPQAALRAGTVGWLFPAPGGVLFAPDLVAGRTTVIDLKRRAVSDLLPAVTMPHFGRAADRYVAALGELLVMSYPERAVLARVDAGIRSPWQVIITPDDLSVLVLERRPDGAGDSTLVAVNIPERQVSFRRDLGTDVVRMALAPSFGLLALTEPARHCVLLVEPATVGTVVTVPVDGTPVDVVWPQGSDQLLVAVAGGDAGPRVASWRLRSHHKALEARPHGSLALPAAPVRLRLSPDGAFIAAATASGAVVVAAREHLEQVATVTLPGAPRDLCWCDPQRPGPVLPDWSDRKAPPPALPSEGVSGP